MKCVIVGDRGTGKTSLRLSIISNNLPHEYFPCECSIDVNIQNTEYQFTMFDQMFGSFEYMRQLQYINTDVFIVCYAMDSQRSLQSVTKRWIPEIQLYQPNVPFILVGMKYDLIETNWQDVTFGDTERIAKQIGAFSHVQCSSLNGFNVKLVVHTAVRAALGGNKAKYQRGSCKK
ncbi:Rac/Rho-like_protein [Hexamita inflata]|uniref:Rac/Rho-like protein n=1 Tax=Hexamita inflata TaxID=28002 RepID=A0AA86RPV6_9EUKA|nr:Rac/Rho-like protein [Hexamita inflata]